MPLQFDLAFKEANIREETSMRKELRPNEMPPGTKSGESQVRPKEA